MKKRKIGIMGGTFDPIHLGHLVVANEVLNTYGLDEMIFVPAGNPPHKRGTVASSHDRYLMTVMATLCNDKFKVSDIEVRNSAKSYTLSTIIEFKNLYKDAEFYFITGTDAIIDLPNWHAPEKLIGLCKFIAVNRPGVSIDMVQAKITEIKNIFSGDIEILQAPMLQISSTDIRSRFRRGVSAKYLLPESVEQYIIKNNLYLERQ